MAWTDKLCRFFCKKRKYTEKRTGPRVVVCQRCGDTFGAKTSKARFCSPKCRIYNSMEKKV